MENKSRHLPIAHIERRNMGWLPGGLVALCDDGSRPDLSLVEKARQLLLGGVRFIQLRAKKTNDAQLLHEAREITDLCKQMGATLVINDRADLALMAGAHGVHLGSDDLPLAIAREILGPQSIVGATVRNRSEIEAAWAAGADYVGLGPLFHTTTKTLSIPPIGLEMFAAITKHSPLPVIGIGGICLANIADVATAGAYGAAVASDLFRSDDIAKRASALSLAFERSRR